VKYQETFYYILSFTYTHTHTQMRSRVSRICFRFTWHIRAIVLQSSNRSGKIHLRIIERDHGYRTMHRRANVDTNSRKSDFNDK